METGGASALAGETRTAALAERPNVLTSVVRGRDQFLKLKAEWDSALTAGPDPSPALEHDYLRLWLETFAASQTPIAVTARRENKLAAALGFYVSPGVVDGVPLRLAQSWCNSHSMRGGLLLGPGGVAALPALGHRACEEGWDALCLRDVPREGGLVDALGDVFRAEGCTVALESPMDSPYVPLPAEWGELEKRLDARFRQNLRRRRRRLEEHGTVRFEVIETLEGLDTALEDAFAIEASGWKGAEGSAIRSRPELVSFYSSWARRLAQAKRLRLCFLALGERRIAFHFGFVHGRRYYLPKCGFDESHQECSPGQLLMAEVLRRCMEEQLESFEFLGFNMPWKRDWTPLVRPHATLWVFQRTRAGRFAGFLRARVRPGIAGFWRALRERFEARRVEA
jgi:hypothetical protein